MMLAEHENLCATRAAIERQADQALELHSDYQRLRTLPGVGPILALTILAEAGDCAGFRITDNSSSSVLGSQHPVVRAVPWDEPALKARAMRGWSRGLSRQALTIMVLTIAPIPERKSPGN